MQIRTPKHFFGWFFIAIFFTLGCCLAYLSYLYYNPRVSFQEYAPSKLPAGMSLGTKTLELWSSPQIPLWSLKTDVRVSLGEHASLFEEQLTSNLSTNECSSVVNQKCMMSQTSKGQMYRMVTTYSQLTQTSDSKPTNIVATFDKNNTRILINFDQTAAQVSFDWDSFIDSFKTTTFNNLQVKHMYPGP